MRIDQKSCPFPLSAALVAILESELSKAQLPTDSGAILSFRDPGYSPETGGFHPLEIHVDSRGRVRYITDFAFVGRPPFAELAKEIDFDFALGLFQHFGREYPLQQGRELFGIWQANFCSYYAMQVFTVSVEGD